VGPKLPAISLREAVFKCLASSTGEKLKARDIAQWIIDTYPHFAAEKQKNSIFIDTPAKLRNQFVAEIGSNRPFWEQKYSSFRTTAEKPRRYYWTDESDQEVVEAAEAEDSITKKISVDHISEADLYPKLKIFLKGEFDVLSMRIDEKTASNKKGINGNKWLFPDICGMQNLISGYEKDILSIVSLAGGRKCYLWSFEVKLVLNSSNVREAYFQAVSNSSWANYGYLVAADISSKVMNELRVLHNLHGIGVIKLDQDDPFESQTLIQARLRDMVDWGAMNRLAAENADFRDFAKFVKQFHQSDETNSAVWR
jgi:hypothetical protein